MNSKLRLLMCLLPMAVAGCTSDDFEDIKQYMEAVRAQHSRQIEPVPIYPQYKSFIYSMMAKRSPFEPPVASRNIVTNCFSLRKTAE